ncbi:MAG TPA: tetratricopeptide repeat protein [Candidatus Limnocylindrales bacterium]
MRPNLRLVGCALAFVLLSSFWGAASPSSAAGAQSYLGFTSDSTWQADPVAGRVHVVAVITATSHTVDDTRRYYYDRIQLTLPPSSASIVASAAGQQLAVGVQTISPLGVVVLVYFGQRLYSGQSMVFVLKFELVDRGGSTDRDLRIGHNLMSFPVKAFGSPDTPGSTVTVVFPSNFAVQEEYGGLTRAANGSGEVVFSSGVLDDATALNAWFTAVQPVPPGSYRVRSITIGPLSVALRYWVDDVGWADQVERVLRGGYPILRDLIGLGDPIGTTLTVVEASSQEIGGFSGSYDAASGQVQISYLADPFVILHEAAHMWFNGDLLSERWADEGFASYYAQQTVDRLGLADHSPVLTERMREAAVPLNDWIGSGSTSSATDSYLYGASLRAAQLIATRVGQANLRDVWAAVRSGRAAYQPIHAPPSEILGGGPADWRRILDLLEQISGLSVESVWRQWVVDPGQESLLDQRAAAVLTYASAQGAAGEWELPAEIRRSMDTWQFQQAGIFMAQAQTVLIERGEIEHQAAAEQTIPPANLQTAFEHSGLVDATAEAAAELTALREMAGARVAQTDSVDAARGLGLLGSDPRADLDASREAFASGDVTRATALAARARIAWQSAGSAGQARIIGGLCLLLGILLLAALYVWTRGAGLKPKLPAVETGPEDEVTRPSGLRASARAAGRVQFARLVAAPREVWGRFTARRDLPAAAEDEPRSYPPAPPGPPRSPEPPDASSKIGVDDHSLVTSETEGAQPAESAYDLLQRGSALLEDHHNAQAAVVLERAARLEPNMSSILEALGRAYFNSSQPARAAATFQSLLDVDPSAHYGHFALGLSFARLGRPLEARTHLRLATAMNPSNETYRRALERAEAAKK